MIKTLINTASKPIATFVFAHGAGAGQNSEFMQLIAQGLSHNHNINVLRFNFAYMQLSEDLGKRRPPERADKLLSQFQSVLNQVDESMPVFLGGKSMGGRMASMLLEESNALGCICMGYPFHPPGKPEKLRTQHLQDIHKPLLILQGERDTFGTRNEIDSYNLCTNIAVSYLADGDHSFKPRKASGVTLTTNIDVAIKRTADFIKSNI